MKTKQMISLMIFPLFILIIATSAKAQNKENPKRYQIKSGKIIYQVNTLEGKGTTIVKFDNYGMRESKHQILKKNGKTKKDELIIINGENSYFINLLSNNGTVRNLGGTMKMMQMGGKDMSATGKKMLQTMGGKQIGTQNFLGKNCEKWEVNTMGKTTMLIWKGVTLKSETSVMGMKTSEVATSITTGLSFSNADFQPPAGIQMENPQGMGMGQGMEMSPKDKAMMNKMSNMSFADFKKMMKKDNPNLSDDEIRQSYNIMKQMGKFLNK